MNIPRKQWLYKPQRSRLSALCVVAKRRVMATVMSMVNAIRLTVVQWVMLSMAVVIGVLVVMFELQGSKLHKAQVELLRAHLGSAMDKQDAAAEASKKRFQKAQKVYEETK